MADIHHDQDNTKFIISVDGQEAGFCQYRVVNGARVFDGTLIEPEFRGQGLSQPLIKAALDDTREAGLKVVPVCSAVEHFVAKHDDYSDVLER